MTSLQKDMLIYQEQLQLGAVQRAYKGLLEYLLSLRTHFQKNYPDYSVPGSLYTGYMDMSYFSIVPADLKQRGLKIALVFLHEATRFEVWLSAYNKQVQSEYWQRIRQSGWEKYRLVPELAGADSILEYVLIEHPDFSDLETLTSTIEQGAIAFIGDVQKFLKTL